MTNYAGPSDADAVGLFIREKYLSLNVGQNGEPSKREMYPYFTCATDTEAMKFIIAAVKDIILQKLLSRVGML
jgi:guanine nucleotide-binding protein subunit alpha